MKGRTRSAGPPPPSDNPWARSLWLDGVVHDLTPREALSGDHTCDVAIVGAGFGGLWTAYYLKKADPSLRVTVVEAEIAGFGGAGRNGGFASTGIAGSGSRYARRSGWDSVLRAEREVQHAIDEIGSVVSDEGIDCAYKKSGALTVATTEPQLQRLRERVAAKHRFGLGPEDIRLLSPDESRRARPRAGRSSCRVLHAALRPRRPRSAGPGAGRCLRASRRQDLRADAGRAPWPEGGAVQERADLGRRRGPGDRVLHHQGAGSTTQVPAALLPDDRHRTPSARGLGRARVEGRPRIRRHGAPLLLRHANRGRQDRPRVAEAPPTG